VTDTSGAQALVPEELMAWLGLPEALVTLQSAEGELAGGGIRAGAC
jgi:hypothetical protein